MRWSSVKSLLQVVSLGCVYELGMSISMLLQVQVQTSLVIKVSLFEHAIIFKRVKLLEWINLIMQSLATFFKVLLFMKLKKNVLFLRYLLKIQDVINAFWHNSRVWNMFNVFKFQICDGVWRNIIKTLGQCWDFYLIFGIKISFSYLS